MTKKSTRKYPFKAWVLMPSFKPVEIEIATSGWMTSNFHATSSGKLYSNAELFDTKVEAIAAGRAKLKQHQDRLDKQIAAIAKKAATLDKAEGQP